jgi:uncharacterized protein
MSFETMASLIARALSDPSHGSIEFDWHGGEPTVLPIGFYEKALHIQSRFRKPHQSITNTIQTNATLLTREWVKFLKENGIAVGISIDGPPSVHNRFRLDRAGRPTLERTLQGLRLLREYGIEPGVGVVVDREGLEEGPSVLFDFLIAHNIRHVGLNFVMPDPLVGEIGDADGAHYADPAQTVDYLIGLYDRWHRHNGASIYIRELAAITDALHGLRPIPCTHAGRCFGLVFRIEPNGDVYHCDYFGQDPRYRWGNIRTDDFATFRENAPLLERAGYHAEDRQRLRACQEFAVCRGWCPHVRSTSRKHYEDHSDDCCGLRPLIEHIRENPPVHAPQNGRLSLAVQGPLFS